MKKSLLPLAALLPLCAAAQQRYNIVYIMTDDHTAQMLSAYDSRNIKTPNLDRIAQDGVKFTRSFVANSLSGPSRACMLTGKHSHKNGFTNNEHGIFNGAQQTMPKLLQKAGYQTSIVGKWHLVSEPTGFDHWDILPAQGNYYDPDFYNAKGSYKVKGYLTNIITDKAIQWLDEERDPNKPFALFVHHKACHRDGKALAEYKFQRYMRDYAKVVKSLDDNVGRLLDYLKEKGLLDNTLVVYTSDQGFYMGEHGWFDKRFMYEESLNTPLLMHLPKGLKARGDINEMVQNIDYAPTFLELAGAPIPSDIQGVSLVPLLKGQHPKNWRKSVYYHYYEYPAEHSVRRHYGVRGERYKLMHFYNDNDAWELYDLKNDPTEMHNLYGDPKMKQVTKEMKKELLRLQKQYDDSIRFQQKL